MDCSGWSLKSRDFNVLSIWIFLGFFSKFVIEICRLFISKFRLDFFNGFDQ